MNVYQLVVSFLVTFSVRVVVTGSTPQHNCTTYVNEWTLMTCSCWASSPSPVVSWTHHPSGTIVATGHSVAHLTLDFGQTVGCEDGWTYFERDNTCIRLVPDKRPWSNARGSCQDSGGDLVRIPDSKMQSFIEGLLTNGGVYDSVYIGLRDRWEFSLPGDNTAVSSSLWATGEPNNLAGDEDCVAMKKSGSAASLMDCPCSDLNGFVYQEQEPYTPPCNGYYISGVCYFVEANNKKNWEHASQYCENLGAQLAVVDSAATHTIIYNLVNTGAFLQGFPFYIGMHNVREFYWLDDDPSIGLPFTKWKIGSPSMTNTTARCVVVDAMTGKWQEQVCDVQSSFLCQKDAVSFGPLPRTYECKVASGMTPNSLSHTFRLPPTTTEDPTTTTPPPTTPPTTTPPPTTPPTTTPPPTTPPTTTPQPTTPPPTTPPPTTPPPTTPQPTTTTPPTTTTTPPTTTPQPTTPPTTPQPTTTPPPTPTTTQQPPPPTPPSSSTLPTPSQPPSPPYWSCTCSQNLITNLTEVQVIHLTFDLQKALAVHVDSLSATIRKKNCAKDPRLTPRIAATVAMAILAISFLAILVSDCFKFSKFHVKVKAKNGAG